MANTISTRLPMMRSSSPLYDFPGVGAVCRHVPFELRAEVQRYGWGVADRLPYARMILAGDRIANTGDSISEIAQWLGYESASALREGL